MAGRGFGGKGSVERCALLYFEAPLWLGKSSGARPLSATGTERQMRRAVAWREDGLAAQTEGRLGHTKEARHCTAQGLETQREAWPYKGGLTMCKA